MWVQADGEIVMVLDDPEDETRDAKNNFVHGVIETIESAKHVVAGHVEDLAPL